MFQKGAQTMGLVYLHRDEEEVGGRKKDAVAADCTTVSETKHSCTSCAVHDPPRSQSLVCTHPAAHSVDLDRTIGVSMQCNRKHCNGSVMRGRVHRS